MLVKVRNLCVLLLVVVCTSCKKNHSIVPVNTTDSLSIGLIAYYPLNGNLKDESGNNYDLDNHGAISGTDRFGNSNGAYYFDGENAKMVMPSMPKAVSLRNFTVSFWIKMDSLNYAISFLSNPLYICDYSTAIWLGQDSRGTLFCENDIIYTDTTLGCGTLEVPFGIENPVNKWTHIVLVQQYIDSPPNRPFYKYYSYLNGVAKNPLSSNFSDNSPKVVSLGFGGAIGCFAHNEFDHKVHYEHFLKGSMDDIRIYDRALSATEINDLYTLQK